MCWRLQAYVLEAASLYVPQVRGLPDLKMLGLPRNVLVWDGEQLGTWLDALGWPHCLQPSSPAPEPRCTTPALRLPPSPLTSNPNPEPRTPNPEPLTRTPNLSPYPGLGQIVPAFLDHNINGGTVFLLTEVSE